MSRSIEVTESTYSALEAAAAAEGATPDKWLDTHLPDVIAAAEPTELATGEDGASRTLYDRMKHLIGTVSLDYTDLAERHSEYFAEGMLEKHRQGTL